MTVQGKAPRFLSEAGRHALCLGQNILRGESRVSAAGGAKPSFFCYPIRSLTKLPGEGGKTTVFSPFKNTWPWIWA